MPVNNPLFYVKFDHNRSESLGYVALDVEKSKGEIPSDDKIILRLKLKMTDGAYLWARGINPGDGNPAEELVTKVDELLIMAANRCELALKIGSTGQKIELQLQPDGTRIYVGGYFSFSRTIEPRDIEHLAAWRPGEDVYVNWIIQGYAALGTVKRLPGYDVFPNIIAFTAENTMSRNEPKISPREFVDKMVVPAGLGDRFIAELALDMPQLLSTIPNLPPGISALKQDLPLLTSNLKTAVASFRNAGTADDLRAVLAHIRTPLDSILTFQNKKDLAKELYVDTGIIQDVDPNGATEAAQEIIEDIWVIFQKLHDIVSKGIHTTTKQTKTRKSNLSFQMKPVRANVEYALISALAASNTLVKLIELSIARK
ncbi:MAG: hypothetical protein AB1753_08260 [Thermoproteota archaeon]